MLDPETFKTVVASTPLVSIDLCLVHDGKILLGLRQNEPLKGQWFTSGGRILKNERWQDALERIAKTELGLPLTHVECQLMGVWDHFYANSAVGADVSTHYVNLPHVCFLKERPALAMDAQHGQLKWHPLKQVATDDAYHEYMRLYASKVLELESNSAAKALAAREK